MAVCERRSSKRDRVGGSCFHRGCYALLTLQACAREFRDRWRSGRFGNKVDLLQETLRNWLTTQSNVSSRLVDALHTELGKLGVNLYEAHGQFLDERTIQAIDSDGAITILGAENTIVATGSRPAFSGSRGQGW